jgi:uncharacterized iron-regulated membrane protein
MSAEATATVPAPENPDLPVGPGGGNGSAASSLYRAVWRWHFYAGLFAIPVIVLLCLTGILYLFRPQLDSLLYGSMRDVAPGQSIIGYEQQYATVQAQFPDGSVDAVMPQPKPDRSTQFEVTAADGTPHSAYVNPYTGEYLGSRNHNHDPSYIALQLHGSLWSGAWLGWLPGPDDPALWGDWYIELVASWTIVLVVTGLYLWWPRGRQKRRLAGVVVPRWSARNRRIRWRDLHAVTGVLFAFITLFFVVSGLAWTGFWGPNVLTRVMDTTNNNYPPEILEGATSTVVADQGRAGWASGQLPVPLSGAAPDPGSVSWDPTQRAPIDVVVAEAQKEFGTGFGITMPVGETDVYTVGKYADVDPQPVQSATDGGTMFVDQYSAQPIAVLPWSDFTFGAKAFDWSISVHEGREWGWISQVLVLIAALALLVSVASSLVMWRKRRPRGLGAPRREPDRKLALGVLTITLVLGVMFPLLGGSILAILIFEVLLIRRVPRLARAFGLPDRSQQARTVRDAVHDRP